MWTHRKNNIFLAVLAFLAANSVFFPMLQAITANRGSIANKLFHARDYRFLCRANLRLFHINHNHGSDVITSNSNSKVKLLKSLKMKKKRSEMGLVLVEGHRIVIDAIRYGVKPRLVLFSDRAMTAPMGAELSGALYNNKTWEVEEAVDSVMASISDTVSNQGVVAAFPMPEQISQPEIVLSTDSCIHNKHGKLTLLLDGISDPGNMGSLIRSSYGMGVDAIVLAPGCCDPWSPKVVRSSMGLCLQLPILQLTWDEIIAYLKQSVSTNIIENANCTAGGANFGMQVLIAESELANTSSDSSRELMRYDDVDYTQPTLLVVGSEAAGVSRQSYLLPGKRITVTIPMIRRLESINAAIAGSILLAEAAKQRLREA